MSRTVMIAGNWKLNLSVAEGAALVEGIIPAAQASPAEVVVCPTALGISAAVSAAADSSVAVGAQNAYWQESGAFTGELSPSLIKAAGASHVILGHSERRQLFGDTDEAINQRLKAVLAAGLVPLVCIGETLEERDGGQLETVLKTQITGSLAGLTPAELSTVVIAYEPVWAIGTGRVASDEQAQEAHAYVRSVVAEIDPALAAGMRILYGGSVKPGNAAGLLAQPDIDGALVGGASLKAVDFSGIIAAV